MLDYKTLVTSMKGTTVDRPNKASSGTLSGHAAGEPFEKLVYHKLKDLYPSKIFKQYEYLNDLYLSNPKVITVADRYALFASPTVMFLLNRGDKATKIWSPDSLFEEKQDDTADILYHDRNFFDIIDVKTRNISKSAQAPNIISAYKLAETCAKMIDNNDYDNIDIHYIEIDWHEDDDKLKCTDAHFADLFKEKPESLYINWAAAMQIQFHVSDLQQSFEGSKELWARHYIKAFIKSAKSRCEKMLEKYVAPYLKYISTEDRQGIIGDDNNSVSVSISINNNMLFD